MSRYCFDIETDNLLHGCKNMWVLVTEDLNTGDIDYWKQNEYGWKKKFNNANLLMGHNIINFDIPVLEKLFDYKIPKRCTIHDTLIMSQVLNYKRFGTLGHSLKVWGENLGYPKIDFEDWSGYSEEMLTYCKQDVSLNVKVYNILIQELRLLAEKHPLIKTYLKAEHAAAQWSSQANYHGWPFDIKAAKELYQTLETEMEFAFEALSARLGLKTVAKDKCKGEVPSRKPKWTKQGCYDVHTSNWFGIDPWSGYEGEERRIAGEYSRVVIEPLKLSSTDDMKIFLFRNGWVPTEYNTKLDPNSRERKKTSPKITEDSIEFLGGDGKIYTNYMTTKSRFSILKTWLENVDENGNLHGDCFGIGTPSMRSRHSIIVNVPSVDSKWGKEMRQLFTCKQGWKLVGCDSSGNQARGLAYYLNDPVFTETLLNGDIHQYNADVLTEVLRKMRIAHVVPRSIAKRVLYAFLFGASGGKLWGYIFNAYGQDKGRKLKTGFTKAVPGFEDLLIKLKKIYERTSEDGEGYIRSIAGNRIYVDSVHKLLVYLLQSLEKVTCTAAIMLTMERLDAEGIPYIPCIFMHDEEDFMVPEEHAERAAEIGKQAFIDGPKLFGVNIMNGDAKIGDNWYEIH
jgi:DNA polymerase-1